MCNTHIYEFIMILIIFNYFYFCVNKRNLNVFVKKIKSYHIYIKVIKLSCNYHGIYKTFFHPVFEIPIKQ